MDIDLIFQAINMDKTRPSRLAEMRAKKRVARRSALDDPFDGILFDDKVYDPADASAGDSIADPLNLIYNDD